MDEKELYKGYTGITLEVLKKFNALVWSDIDVETNDGSFYSGTILPRSETSDNKHLVIKMATGYNIGIRAEKIVKVNIKGRKVANYKIPEKEFPYDKGKPRVKLFGTGGTIASRLDYRTGAVDRKSVV